MVELNRQVVVTMQSGRMAGNDRLGKCQRGVGRRWKRLRKMILYASTRVPDAALDGIGSPRQRSCPFMEQHAAKESALGASKKVKGRCARIRARQPRKNHALERGLIGWKLVAALCIVAAAGIATLIITDSPEAVAAVVGPLLMMVGVSAAQQS
jgi:hypothetical protein